MGRFAGVLVVVALAVGCAGKQQAVTKESPTPESSQSTWEPPPLPNDGAIGMLGLGGPEKPWTMGRLFSACNEATGQDTKLLWVPSAFLLKHGEDGD